MINWKKIKNIYEVSDYLSQGKTIFVNKDETHYFFLDKNSCLVEQDGQDVVLNPGISMVLVNKVGLFVKEEEPLKIEEDKFYKTRDGRKVYISKTTFTFACGTVLDTSSNYCWLLKNGEESERRDNLDLVSEWSE